MVTIYHILSVFFFFLLYRIFVSVKQVSAKQVSAKQVSAKQVSIKNSTPIHTLKYVVSFASGIAIQHYFEIKGMALYIVFILCLIFFNKTKLALLCCMGALSFFMLQKQYLRYRENIKIIRTRAIVTNVEQRKFSQKISLLTEEVGKIVVFTRTKTILEAGDKIETQLHLTKKGNSVEPSLYEIKERIVATLFLYNFNYIKLNEKKSILEILLKKRFLVYEQLREKMPPNTFAYFSSIFLGNKSASIPETISHQFNYWGIAHQLARSGLHIVLFLLLITIIFSYLPIPYHLKHILSALFCLSYALLSRPSTPFLRAINQFFLYQIGRILNRQTSPLYIIQTVTILALMLNPAQLFFLDFQLSFGLTLALTLAFSLA